MKFAEHRPFANPDIAARKIVELANAFEPIQDGRIYIEKINGPFLFQLKGTPAEYKAGLDRAIANGWLVLHESGAFVRFTRRRARTFMPVHGRRTTIRRTTEGGTAQCAEIRAAPANHLNCPAPGNRKLQPAEAAICRYRFLMHINSPSEPSAYDEEHEGGGVELGWRMIGFSASQLSLSARFRSR